MSTLLSKAAILAARDIVIERCEVPEWDGHVFVKTLSARVKEEWEQERLRVKGSDTEVNLINVRASLAAATMCDAEGQLLFGMEDIVALNEKSVKALDRVFETAVKLNRISAQDVDDLTKNSVSTPGDSSPSA